MIVYDFDGVMTDNRVLLRDDGMESVVVNRADGLAIGILRSWGIRQMILSQEQNKVVTVRAKKLQIPCLRGVTDKKLALVRYCQKEGLSLKNVVYVGNDLNDLDAMNVVGHPVCPADAYAEVKMVAEIVLDVPGGAGVARDLMRHISRPKGKS